MDPQDLYREAERPTERDDRRRTVRRTIGILAGVGVAAAVLVAAVPALRSLLPEPGAGAAAYPTQSVPDGVTVTTTESADVFAGPFSGTAAHSYPKGAAGITLPPAKAVKGFTAAEVGTALKKVRAALIAGRLDTEMLVGHKPAKFLAMLAPNNRKQIAKWFQNDDLSVVATWIDPSVKLHAEEPRVSGRITYASLDVDGIRTLRVTTNFVWVYAFEGPGRPIAAIHDEIEWEFADPDDLNPGDRGTWLGDAESYMAMMDCTAANKGMLAPGKPELAPAANPSDTANPDDWLRPDHGLDIGDDCASAPAKP